MAIFIVDQFSLNTDLPLDIRYVPNGGIYDADISSYKYPGMQVYDTSTQSIWYCDNSLNWIGVGGNLDASLNALYNIVTDLSLYVNDLDSSVTNIFNITSDLSIFTNTLDTSIKDLEVRLTLVEGSIGYLKIWNASQDSSIIRIDNEQTIQDASIIGLRNRIDINDGSIIYNDASIKQLFSEIGSNDGSINDLWNWNVTQDASIIGLRGRLDLIDGSLTYINNVNLSQDASIIDNRQSINDLETSLGLFVLKGGDTMTGDLIVPGISTTNDISIGGDLFLNNNATILGSVGIRGDVQIDGSLTYVNSNVLDISTNFIRLNTGLSGTPPEWLQSGVIVERGDASSYAIIFDESDTTFRVGVVWNPDASGSYLDSQTKPVATRNDNPINNGITFWSGAGNNGIFDTNANLTYDGNVLRLQDASLRIDAYIGATDLMLVVGTDGIVKAVPTADASINDLYTYIDSSLVARDLIITNIQNVNTSQDASIINLRNRLDTVDTSITSITSINTSQDNSILRIDSSINQLFDLDSNNVKGGINIGDGSAAVFTGITTADGSLQFRTLTGVGAATVAENGNLIEISIDASFAGEVNTASNIGDGEGVYSYKQGQNLAFKSIVATDPSKLYITSDVSTIYLDVSIASGGASSLIDLTDTSIDNSSYETHQILEFDNSINKWKNTNGILWDTSLGTTTDDLDGIPQGTNLEGLTLKEILFKILYEYQVPVLSIGSDPSSGIYEKGIPATQFASIDVSYYTANTNFPIAKLNNLTITKTGAGTILDTSLGLIDTSSGTFTDATGITNWGGTDRTINYNIYIADDQSSQTQPAIVQQESFTFYYKQFWGVVNGNTLASQVNSDMIKGLSNSRLAGETDLLGTFDNSSGSFVKYLFAYVDTVASPDNFGTLSQIIDQNGFDLTDSFTTQNEDVSIGNNNVRYRFYLLNNKVDTSTFEITFKF